MTFDRFWILGKLTLGFGLSTELWYTTRKNDSKVIHFLNIGYVPDIRPGKACSSSLFVFTLLWITMKVGIFKDNRAAGITVKGDSDEQANS